MNHDERQNAATLIYRQPPQFAPRSFVLYERSVVLVGYDGGRAEKTIRLSQISPDFIPVKRRVIMLLILPIIAVLGMGALGWWVSRSANNLVELAIGWVLLLLSPFLLTGMRLKPFDGVCFVNDKNEILFEFFQTQKGAWKYTDFLKELTKRIRAQRAVGQP